MVVRIWLAYLCTDSSAVEESNPVLIATNLYLDLYHSDQLWGLIICQISIVIVPGHEL